MKRKKKNRKEEKNGKVRPREKREQQNIRNSHNDDIGFERGGHRFDGLDGFGQIFIAQTERERNERKTENRRNGSIQNEGKKQSRV
jgi:hypothetical protein